MDSFYGTNGTGKKIHSCTQNTTSCNHSGQVRTPRIRRVKVTAETPDNLFCKKCFPNGNPER
jgi:hypothetical protein